METKSKLQDQFDLVVLLMDTGARLSEITSMAWSAVDYVNWEWLSVYRSKVKNESKLLLTDRAREILKRRWSRNGNCEYIFQAYGTGTGSRGTSTTGIRKAIHRAGLNTDALVNRYGPFTVHSLRHTFASKLVIGRMSIYGVSKLLGHKDVKTTQRYAHLAVDDVSVEAIQILQSK
jgi:integrase